MTPRAARALHSNTHNAPLQRRRCRVAEKDASSSPRSPFGMRAPHPLGAAAVIISARNTRSFSSPSSSSPPNSSSTTSLSASSLSAASSSASTTTTAKKKTALQSFFDELHMYKEGGKSLFVDVRKATAMASESRKGAVQLTRRDKLFILEARENLQRSIPFIAFFLLPFVGYLAPLVFARYPQHLPPPFWTPAQTHAFRFSPDALRPRRTAMASVRASLVELSTTATSTTSADGGGGDVDGLAGARAALRNALEATAASHTRTPPAFVSNDATDAGTDTDGAAAAASSTATDGAAAAASSTATADAAVNDWFVASRPLATPAAAEQSFVLTAASRETLATLLQAHDVYHALPRSLHVG
jgi:hypothetical protein